MQRQLLPALLFFLVLVFSSSANAARCLFVSSYHPGYPWADGIEQGVRSTLAGHCEIKQFDMDTKRQQDEHIIQSKAKEIHRFIEQWKPDVIITADDNAAKYLVVPYLKNTTIPVVFCGLNWTVDEYGFPASNITGMIEVAPIREVFNKIRDILPSARTGYYLGADTLTEHKSYERFARYAREHRLTLVRRLSQTQKDWKRNYIEAQQANFIILGTESGIKNWDDDQALQIVKQHGHTLSITVYDWLIKFAAIGMHKLPEEHGQWAALAALAILDGTPPSDIPVIPNQNWDMVINPSILNQVSSPIPEYLWYQGKTFNEK